ncbi:HlyD family efflux transporter periplasmic adaptor subunit [Pasteurellaceae bacterium LIM206]|nr:HlyD family efflux transporter periplasmic adaptor subunit [Pasteurellaceae bacterium LIM206]
MKKVISLIIIVLVVAGGGYYYWQNAQQAKSAEHIADGNGRIELKRIDVASLYSGRVKQMEVDEGSQVNTDDILAELSSETTYSRVLSAKSQKQRALETIQRAKAEIDNAQQQRKVAQLELDNAVKLRKDNLVSDSEVTRRRAERDRAVAAVAAAQAAQAEAQASVETAQAQIDEASSVNDDMLIKAPRAGRIEYRYVDEGNVVAPGTRVVSLLDPSDVRMNIFLPMTSMAKLKVGDEARIVLDGIDAVFPATINYIASQNQFTPKAVETTEERTKFMFKIELKIPAEIAEKYNGLLKGGMTGNGYVRLENADWTTGLAVKLP